MLDKTEFENKISPFILIFTNLFFKNEFVYCSGKPREKLLKVDPKDECKTPLKSVSVHIIPLFSISIHPSKAGYIRIKGLSH